MINARSVALLGIGISALAIAEIGLIDISTSPVQYDANTIHGGGGASNGKPIPYDWRSINDLYKVDKQTKLAAEQAHIAKLRSDDEAILSVIMIAVLEEEIT